MKSLTTALFLLLVNLAIAMAPPATRPDAPPVPLPRIIAKAWVEARTIDKDAYPAETKFEYAIMSPQSNEFSGDRWVVTFFRPKAATTASGFPDIVVVVTWNGEKAVILKK